MKKAITTVVLAAFAATCFIGCSSNDVTSGSATEVTSTAEVTTTTTTEAPTTTTTTQATTTETTLSRTISADRKKLDELLAKQPVYISNLKYISTGMYYKEYYLQPFITNKSKDDIKNAYIAFVAWDGNNLPIKIKGDIDFSDGDYIKLVNFNDINLVPGKTYGKNAGYEVDDSCKIKKYKAIVVGYDTFEGKEWVNPYYEAWEKMYGGGKKLTSITSVEVNLTDADYAEMVRKSKEPAEPTKAPTKVPTKKSKKKKKK